MNPRLRQMPRMRRVSNWLFAIAIAGSALAVGTVHPVTLCVISALLVLAMVTQWWRAEPLDVRPVATLLFGTCAALTIYTGLQGIPVPISWIAAIAPYNAEVWSRAIAPLRETAPRFVSLSLDPIATRIEFLKGVAYLLAFVTALRIARRREGVAFLSAVIIVTGLLLATAALLHPAFGARRLYGIYEPGPGIAERHIAPLLNPNNLASYLNASLCLALAAALAPERRVPRAILWAVVLLLGATQLWIASRAGVVTMVLGAFVVVVIARFGRTRSVRARASLSTVAVVAAAAGVVMIVLGGSEQASTELLQTDVDKAHLFVRVMRMLPSVPAFGCGRGAFESTFPAFRGDVGYVTYTHPENVVAQWILEWGLPVGVAGLVAVVWALRPSAVLARSTTAAGAWAAIIAVSVQNLGDLGSEVPGVVLSGVVCAAIVVAGSPGRQPRWWMEGWSRKLPGRALGGAVAALGVIAIGVSACGRDLHADEHALRQAALEHHVGADEMHALARAAMLRHPAEPYLPFIAALRASYRRDENPMPWLEATLERARVYAPAHLVLARVVAPRSPSQARLEYRLAMEQAPDFVGIIMAEAPRQVGSYDDATELVPAGKLGIEVIRELVRAIDRRLPASRVRLDRELAALAPDDPGPALRAAKDAVEDATADDVAPWCEGEARAACIREALEKADRAEKMAPSECEAFALHARALAASGDGPAGLRELERASDTVTDRVACLKQFALLAMLVGDSEKTQVALDDIASSGCGDDAECAQNLSWVAAQEEARGNPEKALAMYKRAYERAPEQDALLESMARLSGRGGLHVEAAEDYETLARRHPDQAQWQKAAQAEKDQAFRGEVPP